MKLYNYTAAATDHDGKKYVKDVNAENMIEAACAFAGWLRSEQKITSQELAYFQINKNAEV